MGRNEERVQLSNLEVKVPNFFRCPISLDVMRSPVSLCTGVTYDRASIQRWLESGNNTCPATMQPLPSTDLVPNLTLRRLIHLWSVAATSAAPIAHNYPVSDLLRDLRTSTDPAPLLRRLADFFLDSDADEFEKNSFISGGGCATAITASLTQNVGQIDTLAAAARVIVVILGSDSIEEGNKKMVTFSLISNLSASVSALIPILKEGRTLESRIDAARVLDAIVSSSDSESRVSITEKPGLIPEMIRLIGEENLDGSAIDAGLGCLLSICGVRRARVRMVKDGIIAAAVNVLASGSSVEAAEKALRILAAASGVAEGRSAICEAAEKCLGAVMERMMKMGREGTEAAVLVLWSVCHLFQDRRAVDAVSAASGGVTKIFLLMQSNCSPAVRAMSGDLLKVFKVSCKSCLAGYDTKTTHIMPL